MKNLFSLLLAAAIVAGGVSCEEPQSGEVPPEKVAVTGVTLDKETLTLTEGGTETLTATVAPEDAANKAVTWSSSDAEVATVDAEGKVTAVAEGTATITVTTADGGKTATCAVTVESNVDLLSSEYIPDPAFLEYCHSMMPSWDTNGNDKLSPTEAAAVISIDVYNYPGGLASLEGIEYFTGLTSLFCSYNQLTALDVSNNTALTNLTCSYNQLTALDVSKNTALIDLQCISNQLTALDVSNNTALTNLTCSFNQLTELDVSKNTELTDLRCDNNQTTALDVSNNTALTNLRCEYNQITALDVSKNTELTSLSCFFNQLTALDVSKNTELTILWCEGNQLTVLDISKNSALINIAFHGNPGDGVSKFPVVAWFDNSSVPTGTAPSGDSYNFTTSGWDYNGVAIAPDYQKAN
jgi:hypothetical protein